MEMKLLQDLGACQKTAGNLAGDFYCCWWEKNPDILDSDGNKIRLNTENGLRAHKKQLPSG